MQLHRKGKEGFDLEPAVRAALPTWRDTFPGLEVTASDHGLRLLIPAELATTHEQHFAMCLDAFMDYLERV